MFDAAIRISRIAKAKPNHKSTVNPCAVPARSAQIVTLCRRAVIRVRPRDAQRVLMEPNVLDRNVKLRPARFDSFSAFERAIGCDMRLGRGG